MKRRFISRPMFALAAAFVFSSSLGCASEEVVLRIDGVEQTLNLYKPFDSVHFIYKWILVLDTMHFTCPTPENMPNLQSELPDAALRDDAHVRARIELQLADIADTPFDPPIDLSSPDAPVKVAGTVSKGKVCEAKVVATRGTLQMDAIAVDFPKYEYPVRGSLNAHFELFHPPNCTPEEGAFTTVDLVWNNFAIDRSPDLPTCN